MTEPLSTSSATALAAALAAAAEIAKQNSQIAWTPQQNATAETTAEIPLSFEPTEQSSLNGMENSCSSSIQKGQCTGQHAESGDKNAIVSNLDEACGEQTSEGFEAESEEDAEKRLARSRERNREHARRTRLRKKAQLAALQSKVKGLEAEHRVLKQSIEECSIASILVGLTSETQQDAVANLLDNASTQEENDSAAKVSLLTGGKRKRFISLDNNTERASLPLKLMIDGKATLIGGGCKSHINWKSGIYSDENGFQRQLTPDQLESLRRERNRMHAKMTRDRKKNFIATIEKTIEDLEIGNQKMKDILSKVSKKHFNTMETPASSPLLQTAEEKKLEEVPRLSVETFESDNNVEDCTSNTKDMRDFSALNDKSPEVEQPVKRRKVSHGFCLND